MLLKKNGLLLLESRGNPLGNTKKFFNQSHHRYFFENTLELIMIKYGFKPFLTTKYPIIGPTRENTIFCLSKFKGKQVSKNFKNLIKFGKKETYSDILFKLKYHDYLAKLERILSNKKELLFIKKNLRERAIENNMPMIIVSCSGGARMQEGIFSLMQMAKTSSALRKLSEKKIPYISILTDPTMGGVSASFSMLGDIILAEPGALIGFAGPRVIEQTIKQKLPKGFQRAEFQLEHGLIDDVVHRKDMKPTLVRLLNMLQNRPQKKINEEEKIPKLTSPPEVLGA